MSNIPDLINRIIDIKQKLDDSDLPLVDRFLIWRGEREFYIDKQGVAFEILENGEYVGEFEVPEELKDFLKKEDRSCPECGAKILESELKQYFGVCNACYWENQERQE